MVTNMGGADGRIRVRHREFVLDIRSRIQFQAASLELNPAKAAAFPWLSSIAQNYESYTFNALAFEYVPCCGTDTSGIVMFAVDYDVRDPLPTTKQTFMQTSGATRCPAWNPASLRCPPTDLHKFARERYTRKVVAAQDGDAKTYDIGQLLTAVEGFVANDKLLGEVYVTYDVEFRTPQPMIIANPADYSSRVAYNNDGGINNVMPLGTAAVDDLVWQKASDSSVLNFKRPGEYLVHASFNPPSQINGAHNFTIETQGDVQSSQLNDSYSSAGIPSSLIRIAVKSLPAAAQLIAHWVNPATSTVLRAAPYGYAMD